MNPSHRSKSFNQRALSVGTPRSLSFGSPRVSLSSSGVSLGFGSPRVSVSSSAVYSCWVILLFASFVSFYVAIALGYVYVLPNLQGYRTPKSSISTKDCDVFDGNWVLDDSYPLYNASQCPFAEQGFNCLGNGRRDDNYLRWRWKPRNCDIPRFNASAALERFRSKRIVLVGDSMSRTQWESLICLLMTGNDDKKSVYEVNGNMITKRIGFLGVRFSSFNFTIEFFRSVFLVQHGWMPKNAPRRVRSTLRLDKLDESNSKWANADVLIFNSGHWWIPTKLFQTGCYFQVGNSIKLGMSISSAYRIALDTWASWVENTVDKNRTRVFFRTFEPSHWSGQSNRVCNVTLYPIPEAQGKDISVFSDIIMDVVKNMTVPVTVLNITAMSAFRSDAHVGEWNDNLPVPDCSHWCLPGVPDMWNEILLSLLLNTNPGHPNL